MATKHKIHFSPKSSNQFGWQQLKTSPQPSICLLHLFIQKHLTIHSFIYMYLSKYLSICPSIHLVIHPSITKLSMSCKHQSIHLFIHPSIYPNNHPSIPSVMSSFICPHPYHPTIIIQLPHKNTAIADQNTPTHQQYQQHCKLTFSSHSNCLRGCWQTQEEVTSIDDLTAHHNIPQFCCFGVEVHSGFFVPLLVLSNVDMQFIGSSCNGKKEDQLQ